MTQNWIRSYKIEIGTITRTIDQYKEEAVSVLAPEYLPTFEVDGITIPSNAIKMSNLPQEGGSIRGFTFTLDTKRGMNSESGNEEVSTLTLYNLDKQVEEIINQEGCVVRVSAGYGGNVNLVYSGDVISVRPYPTGSDKVYEIRCRDGDLDDKNTRVSINYEEGVSEAEIIRDLINRYPQTFLGVHSLASSENKVETGGETITGNLSRELFKILDRNRYRYGRFNGKMVIYPYRLDETTEEYQEIAKNTYVFTKDTIKQIAPYNNNGNKSSSDSKEETGVVVDTFLIPIELGQFFTITKEISPKYAGTYVVERVKTSLQSQGSSWDTSVTGVKI